MRRKKQVSRAYLSYYLLAALVGLVFSCHLIHQVNHKVLAADTDADGVDDTIDACNNPDAPTNLVSYWGFEETSGTDTADSFDSNPGTLTNMTGSEWGAGQVNGALEFDGVDDYIVVSDDDSLSFGDSANDSPFSISAWVKMDDAANFWVTSKGISGSREYLFGSALAEEIYFMVYNQGGGSSDNLTVESIGNPTLAGYEGQWIHLAATYDGSKSETGLNIYLNGELYTVNQTKNGTYTGMANTSNDLLIGNAWGNLSYSSDGQIDEVAIFDRELTQSEIETMYNSGLSSYGYCEADTDTDTIIDEVDACNNPDAPSDLVSYWGFNEPAGISVADSFDSNPGTLTNMTGSEWGAGQVNGALEFDGVDDFVDVPNHSSLQITSTITLEAWVYPTANLGTAPIIAKWDPQGDGNSYLLSLGAGSGDSRARFILSEDGSYDSSFDYITVDEMGFNQWSHVVATFDGANMKIYINGQEEPGTFFGAPSNTPSGIFSNNSNIHIGKHNKAVSGSWNFDGLIDDAAIYSRTLSENEIEEHYLNGAYYSKTYCQAYAPVCGNGIVDPIEDCDDDNSESGDGCSSSCTVEPGYLCEGVPSVCDVDTDSDGLIDTLDACNDNWALAGLIGYWGMEETSGTVAKDAYGANDGSIEGAPSVVDGLSGKTFEFAGDDYVALPKNVPSLEPDFVTMAAWVKPDAYPGPIFYSGGIDYGVGIHVTGALSIKVTTTNGSVSEYTGSIPLDGQWHFVVVAYDGAAVVTYIDGAFVSTFPLSGTMTHSSNPNGVNIGYYYGTGAHFDGLIDEVALFDRALDLGEVQDLYLYGKYSARGYCELDADADDIPDSADACYNPSAPSGLVSYWGLDEGNGLFSVDSYGGYAGTILGDFEWVTGYLGEALELDGVEDQVDTGVDTAYDFDNTDAFSGMAWIKPSTATNRQDIIGKQVSDGIYEGWAFELSRNGNSRLALILQNDAPGGNRMRVTGVTPLDPDTWYHVAFTYDGSSDVSGVKFYINGQEDRNDWINNWLTGSILNDVTLEIGASGEGGSDFNGQIDETAIFNKQLSVSEIKAHYINTKHLALGYCAATPTAVCGNGIVDVGEDCDDSGTADEDGCSAFCLYETGYRCNSEPSVCFADTDEDTIADSEDGCDNTQAPEGVIAYWGFDEADGLKHVDDYAQYTAMAKGDPQIMSGQVGNAVYLDGDGDYLSTYDRPFQFDNTTPFSVSAWINSDDPTIKQDIIGKQRPTGSYEGYNFRISQSASDRRLTVLVNHHPPSGNRLWVTGDTVLEASTWYHVAFTMDGTGTAAGTKIYVNGQQETLEVLYDGLIDGFGNAYMLQIGAAGGGGAQFHGYLDEVAVFDTALSSSEVVTMYNSGVNDNLGYCVFSGTTTSGGSKFHIEQAIRNPYFWINVGDQSTSSQEVVLSFKVEKATEMIISNNADFKGASWQAYQEEFGWTLTETNGPKIVYAYFKNETSTSPMIASVIILTDQEDAGLSFYLMVLAALLGIGGLMWSGRKK
ncbi:LamG-like jellyroll fold domain-containing protein [Patescibacteria group bacterium]